ncbi:MAG: DUF1905 domain-containing protein [Deltaproteobacteria bacterium]|nr:DUF1905 domain-containing protein [Deltaproteobacteria bacterium]
MKARVKLFRPEGAGTGTFFIVPFDVEAAFGKKRPPVVVTIGKITYRTTVAVYEGKPHLIVRSELREKAGVEAGQTVTVKLELDRAARVVALTPEMKTQLRQSKRASDAWAQLSYSHQKEHAAWLADAKKPETRARRLAKWIDVLEALPPKKKRVGGTTGGDSTGSDGSSDDGSDSGSCDGCKKAPSLTTGHGTTRARARLLQR